MQIIYEKNQEVKEKFDLIKKVDARSKRVAEENEKLHQEFQEYKLKYKTNELELKKVRNTMQEMKGNIRVYCRVRPMTAKNEADKETTVVSVLDDCTVRLKMEKQVKDYTFDRCFGQMSSQTEIF